MVEREGFNPEQIEQPIIEQAVTREEYWRLYHATEKLINEVDAMQHANNTVAQGKARARQSSGHSIRTQYQKFQAIVFSPEELQTNYETLLSIAAKMEKLKAQLQEGDTKRQIQRLDEY